MDLAALVVDDDAAMRGLLKRMLRPLSCTVVEADTGAAALAELEHGHFGLVLLDVNLPVVTGVEVLQAMRLSADHRRVPVVAITGNHEQEVISELVRLGVSDVLAKPFKFDQLKQRLQRVVTQASSRNVHDEFHADAASGAGDWVLVADGNAEFRYFVTNALAGTRDTIEAHSGMQALELCLQRRPAVVLLGDGLGLLNGELPARRTGCSTDASRGHSSPRRSRSSSTSSCPGSSPMSPGRSRSSGGPPVPRPSRPSA